MANELAKKHAEFVLVGKPNDVFSLTVMNESATIGQPSFRGRVVDYLSLERNVSLASAAVFILGGEVALSEAVEAELEETFNSEGSTTFEVVPGTTGTMTSVVHGLAAADSQEVSVTSDGPSAGPMVLVFRTT